MPARISTIDPSTVTRGFTYLYRWWIQSELGIVPEAYIRLGGQTTLVCPEWALIGSAISIAGEEIARLRDDLKRPVFVICPELPSNESGLDLNDQSPINLPDVVRDVVGILKQQQMFLHNLGEEDPGRDEWWRTRNAGDFKVWKSRAQRLLLYPTKDEVYGFSITLGKDGGYFFYRSRSCKEEGRIIKQGAYKMSDHALSTGRKVSNLDLLFTDKTVLLFRLLPTGAGYKVFPRRVPGFEGSLE